nr:MAG TPA: hypothetical protein [Caudoviricetes sp.]
MPTSAAADTASAPTASRIFLLSMSSSFFDHTDDGVPETDSRCTNRTKKDQQTADPFADFDGAFSCFKCIDQTCRVFFDSIQFFILSAIFRDHVIQLFVQSVHFFGVLVDFAYQHAMRFMRIIRQVFFVHHWLSLNSGGKCRLCNSDS